MATSSKQSFYYYYKCYNLVDKTKIRTKGDNLFLWKKDLYTNKIGSIIGVDIIENVEIAEIIPESVRNIFFWSKSGI